MRGLADDVIPEDAVPLDCKPRPVEVASTASASAALIQSFNTLAVMFVKGRAALRDKTFTQEQATALFQHMLKCEAEVSKTKKQYRYFKLYITNN